MSSDVVRSQVRLALLCSVAVLVVIGICILGGCPSPEQQGADVTDPGTNPDDPGGDPGDSPDDTPDPGNGGDDPPVPASTTWAGTVTYTVTTTFGPMSLGPDVFDRATTIEFDGHGVPNVLPISVGTSQNVHEMSTDQLRQVGGQATFQFGTTTITATVTDGSSSTTAYRVDLDLAVEISGSPLQGTYSASSAVQPDGTRSFQSTTDLDTPAGLPVAVDVQAQGTLTKQ